jgi:hypothetical protein
MLDGNAAAAAVRAGYSARTAGHLMSQPAISDEIARRQEAAARESRVTVLSLIREAEEARRVAEENGNAAAMVSASSLKGRLCGLLTDKSEDMTKRDAHERWLQEQANLRSAGRMLADAAKSLGLPEDAAPEQIVGAMATRDLPTPEVYELFRAARQAIDDEKIL